MTKGIIIILDLLVFFAKLGSAVEGDILPLVAAYGPQPSNAEGSFSSYETGCMIESNIFYAGNNINKKLTSGIDECANWCGEIPECKIWSISKSSNLCWLKTSNDDRRSNNDKISGTKGCATGCLIESNIFYADNNINKKLTRGIDECANWCEEIPECKFWSLRKSTKWCWLKTSNDDRRSDNDKISGTKGCATGSLNVSSRRPTRSTEDFETMTLSNNVGTTTKTLATSSPIPTPSQPENIEMKRLDELKSSIEKGSLHRTFIQSRPIEVGYIVPYKLHFIWITHPMPKKYLENLKTYRKYNNIYQIHLWLDDTSFESAKVAREEISNIVLHNISDLDMVDFYLFSKATNVGVKADILRYEVVWKEGGIYSDIDSVALKPFDSNFLHSFVMYTLDPYYNLSNAAFGFPKQSNFLKFVLSILEENFAFETYPTSLSGPGFLTSCFLAFNDSNINMINADYLVFHTKKSFTYHTNDANWMKEMQ